MSSSRVQKVLFGFIAGVALFVFSRYRNRVPTRQPPKEIDADALKTWALQQADYPDNKLIKASDYLWQEIGKDFDNGINELHKQISIDTKKLIEYFADLGVREAETSDDSRLKRCWIWLKQHWLEESAALMVILIAALLLRWDGDLAMFPEPIGLKGTVLIAARDLAANEVLQKDDFYSTRLALTPDYFTETNQLEGFIVSRPIARGMPVRFTDVLRPQVSTISDIPSNTIVATSALTLTWSPYQLGAAVKFDQVANHKTLKALRKGTVVIIDSISP